MGVAECVHERLATQVAVTAVSLTRQRIAWVVWTFLLVASLAAVRALNQNAVASLPDDEGVPDLRFGFQLAETAKTRGVDFVHEAPTFDSRLEHIMPQVASTGASVAVADFDKDGWQDFYVTNSSEGSLNRLYRNKGDGTFADVGAQMGVADVNQRDTGVSMGAIWGDYDNDGWDDLFLYRYGRPELGSRAPRGDSTQPRHRGISSRQRGTSA